MLVTLLLPSRDLQLKGSSQRLDGTGALDSKAGPGKSLDLRQHMFFVSPNAGGFSIMPKVFFFSSNKYLFAILSKFFSV